VLQMQVNNVSRFAHLRDLCLYSEKPLILNPAETLFRALAHAPASEHRRLEYVLAAVRMPFAWARGFYEGADTLSLLLLLLLVVGSRPVATPRTNGDDVCRTLCLPLVAEPRQWRRIGTTRRSHRAHSPRLVLAALPGRQGCVESTHVATRDGKRHVVATREAGHGRR
jgi:hypothetical protein